MFAYCENNPIMRVDADGEIWNVIAGAVIGAGLEVLGQLMTGTKFADINWGSVAVEGVLGAVSSVGIPAKITSKVGRVALTALRDVVAPVVADVSIQMFQTRSNKNNNHSKCISLSKTAITASQASINSAVTAGTDRLLKSTSSRMAKAVVHSTRQLFFFTFGLISKFWR